MAHMTLLQCIGGHVVQGVEGMLRVGLSTSPEVVVLISKIEGIAHLIPLEPKRTWLVNNRIDLETWNMLYD